MKKCMVILFFCVWGFSGLSQDVINPNSSEILIGGAQASASVTVDFAQLALVDLEPDPTAVLNFSSFGNSLEAGLPAEATGGVSENSELWLNYSLRIPEGSFADLIVDVNTNIGRGVKLQMQIITQNLIGAGQTGVPNTTILSLTPGRRILIADIQSCHTGDGEGVGYQINYIIDNPNNVPVPPDFRILYEFSIR